MKLYCRGRYRNAPLGLQYDAAGVIDVDERVATILLRDAPENFTTELPAPEVKAKSVDKPPMTTAIPRAPRTKSAGG